MSEIDPLREDLLIEARNRMRLWAKDTIMRCEAADLPGWVTQSIMVSVITELMLVCLPDDTSLKAFLTLMELVFRDAKKFTENRGHRPNTEES